MNIDEHFVIVLLVCTIISFVFNVVLLAMLRIDIGCVTSDISDIRLHSMRIDSKISTLEERTRK